MTAFADPIALPRMHLHRAGRVSLSCIVGETIGGVEERDECAFEFELIEGQVFADDVRLARHHDGTYRWQPAFIAGRVDIDVVDSAGAAFRFHLDVAPAGSKIDVPRYESMLSEIRAFRAAMLLGDSAARHGFGPGQANTLDDMVRLSRLVAHGLHFVAALRVVSRSARPAIRHRPAMIPLSRAKRVNASALRDPRIASFANGDLDAQRALALAVSAPLLEPTLDTAAHRALKLLAKRVESATADLLRRVSENQLGGQPGEHALRRERRESALRDLYERLRATLRTEPFSSVSRPEITATGLTQLAASPPCSTAYRLGLRVLNLGVDGSIQADQLPVRPTWGVYETWCYVALLKKLSEEFGKAWEACDGKCAADESWQLRLPDNVTLELHFQARFPALPTAEPGRMWSVSRERVPDILLVLRHDGRNRFALLDAKYRRQRPNVLEAMESAHLYRDSLRMGHTRPDFCFLLLPASADVGHLDTDACHGEHQVGTICDFAPERTGLARCTRIIRKWIWRDSEESKQ
jgi:hypothetical protein